MSETENKLKIRDCVEVAAVLLQLENVVAALEAGREDMPDAATEKELDLLVRCGNLVLGEVAEEYIPLRTTETVATEEKKIPFAKLSKKTVDVFSVKRDGKRVRFRVFFDGILVPFDGEYSVEYAYAPSKGVLSGVSEYSTNKPSARVVAYGIAREYCLISGMATEAVVWDKKFKDSLAECTRPKKECFVPARGWR